VTKCVITSKLNDATSQNILYLLGNMGSISGLVPADLTAIANTVMGYWGNLVKNLTSTAFSTTQVTLQWLPDTGAVVEGTSTATAIPGLSASPPLSAQACLCLSWQAGLYYRGGKPRSYIMGITEAALASGSSKLISASAAAQAATDGNTFISDLNALTYVKGGTTYDLFGVGTVSFAKGGEWRVPPVAVSYTSCLCGQRLDTQRRRLGKEPVL
jgi:hypothetical protein